MATEKTTAAVEVEAVEEKKPAAKKTASTKKSTTTKAATEKKSTTKKAAAPKAEAAPAETAAVEVKEEAPKKKAAPKKKKAATVTVRLVKSFAGRLDNQIATCKSMGLRKIGDVTVQPDNAALRGKLAKISHLVEVTEA